MPRFIVMTARAAAMPSSVKSPYRYVAILQLEEDLPENFRPKMISMRAKGVAGILYKSGTLHAGGANINTAYAKTLNNANRTCERLNSARLATAAIMRSGNRKHLVEYVHKLMLE